MDTLLEKGLRSRLLEIEQQGCSRSLVAVQHTGPGRISIGGKQYCNLSGNDYLGLADNKALLQEFYHRCTEDLTPPGSGASRLMSGNSAAYDTLEQSIAKLYGSESALIFNSGYHVNIGILPTLAGKRDLIVADKLCHASLIDGMRLARAELMRYPHNDLDRLEELLKDKRQAYEQVFIVTESVFSMDGDTADLNRLVQTKKSHNCCLYLDEAHAVGVLGDRGLGLAAELGVLDDIDILVGPLGKAWASQGAFVVCSSIIRNYLINTSRSLIYTTALPPLVLAWLQLMVEKLPQMERERRHLAALSAKLRLALADQSLEVRGASHIVPVMVGDSRRCIAVAEKLREQGYWLTGVRPPTVPKETSRLRLSLSAALKWSDIERLPTAIAKAMAQI